MIDKDKVRELVNMLQANQNLDCYERKTYFEVIEKWLEQNQPESVVVGLTDKQVRELNTHFVCEKPNVNSPKECYAVISNYIKTQTFTQPEAKEVVVGLSGEQVDGLINYLKGEGILQDRMNHAWKIRDYLNTQDFTQPEKFTPSWDDAPSWANWVAQDGDGQWNWFGCKPIPDDNLMSFTSESLDDVYARVRSVIKNWQQTLQERPSDMGIPITEQKQEVKAEKSEESTVADVSVVETKRSATINWDNAPKNAVIAAMMTTWWDEKGKEITTCRWQHFQENRPKPTPEAGQVWQYKGGSKYHIDSLGRMKFEPHTGWVDCVTFRKLEGRDAGQFFTRTMDDFMAKFVRVSDDS